MDINNFMKDNNIAILVEADVKSGMFHIYKTDIELKSYTLFEPLILFGSTESLSQSVSGQILPVMWAQGDTKCAIFNPGDEKIICVFYEKNIDAKENYIYAGKLSDKINEMF